MLIDGAPLDAPAAALHDLLRVGLEAAPDEVAMVSAEGRIAWRELEEASLALAGGYLALGLKPGDRIASLMPNRIGLAVHYLACFRAGLVATPLNYRYTFREIDHALEVSGASTLLAHTERGEDLAASELVGELPLGPISYRDPGDDDSPVGPHDFAELLRAEPAADLMTPEPSDPAAIFFTSGSTGPAKGVTHSHETLRWMMASAISAFGLSADDVFLPGSSMSHIGSFLWTLSTLAVGGRVVVARTYDSHELLPPLRERRPTVLAMIPAALAALISRARSDRRSAASASRCATRRAARSSPAPSAASGSGRAAAWSATGRRPRRPRRSSARAGWTPATSPAPTRTATSGSSVAMIVFCRERIGYKAPEEVVVLDEMPLNPTGKIDPRRPQADGGGPPPPARARVSASSSAAEISSGCSTWG